jgi:hypothetical protein
MIGRSNRAEVRNPLVALPSFRALGLLGPAERAALRALLLELRADARLGAAECWRRRKPPMAAYWAAVAVYAGHAARALLPPRRRRGEGRAERSVEMSIDRQTLDAAPSYTNQGDLL